MILFFGLRKGLRGIDADPGPFRPQHGITWMIAWPARWHGHLQSLRNIIGECHAETEICIFGQFRRQSQSRTIHQKSRALL
jgi:hypothetical protein